MRRELDLTGWVRNRRDGNCRGGDCGRHEDVEAMIAAMPRGPAVRRCKRRADSGRDEAWTEFAICRRRSISPPPQRVEGGLARIAGEGPPTHEQRTVPTQQSKNAPHRREHGSVLPPIGTGRRKSPKTRERLLQRLIDIVHRRGEAEIDEARHAVVASRRRARCRRNARGRDRH